MDFISKIKNLRDRKYLDKLQQVKEWFDKTLGQKIEDHKYSINILDLYACKVNGHFVGQELWKQFGYSIELKFNLKQSSLSMRILNSYLEKKSAEEGVPEEEFLQIPHAELPFRRFALLPLAEIASGYWHPKLRCTIDTLLQQCPDQSPVHTLS